MADSAALHRLKYNLPPQFKAYNVTYGTSVVGATALFRTRMYTLASLHIRTAVARPRSGVQLFRCTNYPHQPFVCRRCDCTGTSHLELILTSSRLAVVDINPQLTVGRVPVVTARGDSHSPSLLLHSLRGRWVGHITSLLA